MGLFGKSKKEREKEYMNRSKEQLEKGDRVIVKNANMYGM